GGAEWGGAAVDPDGVLYVNANEMPWILEMVPTKSNPNVPAAGGERLFAQICAACHGLDRRGNRAQNVPTLVGVAQKLKTEDIVRLLGTGRGVMPSFGFLSERQKTLLAATVLGVEEGVDSAAHTGAIAGDDVLGGIPYGFTGYNRWVDTNGYPMVKP